MAAKKSTTAGPTPEQIVRTAFAAAAQAFQAVADLYQGVDAALEAGASAAATTTTAAAAAGPKPVSLDDTKNVLMELIGKLGNDRTKVNEIIAKHAGKVMAIKDVPDDKRAGIVADAKAELDAIAKGGAKAPVSADDL